MNVYNESKQSHQASRRAVERKCVNCGWISNLVYHGIPAERQNKEQSLDSYLSNLLKIHGTIGGLIPSEKRLKILKEISEIAEMGRWRKYKY